MIGSERDSRLIFTPVVMVAVYKVEAVKGAAGVKVAVVPEAVIVPGDCGSTWPANLRLVAIVLAGPWPRKRCQTSRDRRIPIGGGARSGRTVNTTVGAAGGGGGGGGLVSSASASDGKGAKKRQKKERKPLNHDLH